MRHRPGAPLQRHPRLERYTGRVADLLADGSPVGWLLVVPSWYARRVGGHLWWTRWAPARHAVESWVFLSGADADLDAVTVDEHDPRFSDHWGGPDDLEAELDGYEEGVFFLREAYDLRWLDEERSRSVARRVFGWPDARS